jgi:hypothetical protein
MQIVEISDNGSIYILKEEQTFVFITLHDGRFMVGCKCVFKVKLKI